MEGWLDSGSFPYRQFSGKLQCCLPAAFLAFPGGPVAPLPRNGVTIRLPQHPVAPGTPGGSTWRRCAVPLRGVPAQNLRVMFSTDQARNAVTVLPR